MRRVLRRRGRLSPSRRVRLTRPDQPSRPLQVAVYISRHGVGHAVRVAAVLDELRRILPLRRPLRLIVISGAGRRIWPLSLCPLTDAWLDSPCDAGVVQSDDLTVDHGATAERLERWLGDLPAIVERESRRLRAGFDAVIGDVPSPAFAAAKRVGIPSFAVANFSWDWIYSELGFPAAAEAAASGYAVASLLLEAAPFAPMPAFGRRTPVGLIAREPEQSRAGARSRLGLREDELVTLIAFQPSSAPTVVLPPPRPRRSFLVPTGWPRAATRPDVRELAQGARFEDALASADVVVGKPGYGLIGDVEAAGARFLYVPRPGFPENAVLERHLAARSGTAALAAQRLANGQWDDDLEMLESAGAPAPAEAGGAGRAAREIIAMLVPMLGIDSARQPD